MVEKCIQLNRVRLATLDELRKTVLPVFMSPIPSKWSLVRMFDRGKVRRFKANPLAKRGGGPVYYFTADVEKLLNERITRKLHVA